jgi:hypothetical protein
MPLTRRRPVPLNFPSSGYSNGSRVIDDFNAGKVRLRPGTVNLDETEALRTSTEYHVYNVADANDE